MNAQIELGHVATIRVTAQSDYIKGLSISPSFALFKRQRLSLSEFVSTSANQHPIPQLSFLKMDEYDPKSLGV